MTAGPAAVVNDVPGSEATGPAWLTVTAASAATRTIWPTASSPVTARVTVRPRTITTASATGRASSSSGWSGPIPGRTAGRVS